MLTPRICGAAKDILESCTGGIIVQWRVIVVFLASTAMFAASSVGSVSSMGPIEVGGTKLLASTVSSWPLVGGDVISTGNSPAVVFLTGKGRVTLDANTRVRLERQGEQLSVRLLDGSLNYDLVAGSDLLFYNGSSSFAPAAQTVAATQGSVAASTASVPSVQPKFATKLTVARPTPSVVGP